MALPSLAGGPPVASAGLGEVFMTISLKLSPVILISWSLVSFLFCVLWPSRSLGGEGVLFLLAPGFLVLGFDSHFRWGQFLVRQVRPFVGLNLKRNLDKSAAISQIPTGKVENH